MDSEGFKSKSTVNEQIEQMKQNGVRFEIVSEDEARDFLRNHTFFFKVKAYDKNFDKYQSEKSKRYGQYIDLDFAYLVELSRLDKEIRYLIMAAALDIEHYIKVHLNRAFMDDEACDGYKVVEDFMQLDTSRKAQSAAKGLFSAERRALAERASAAIASSVEEIAGVEDHDQMVAAVIDLDKSRALLDEALGGLNLNHIEQSIARLEASSYSKRIAQKYGQRGSMAYWNFLELATFGDIISFYKYYFNDVCPQPDPVAKKTKRLLFPVKTLRNAAAHNSCLLNELRRKLKEPIGLISRHMERECHIDPDLTAQTKRVPIVHDFGALLIAYDAIVISATSRAEMAGLLQGFNGRMHRHLDYFSKQGEVYNVLSMLGAMSESFAAELRAV